MKTNFF
jgi:hypothetical protein